MLLITHFEAFTIKSSETVFEDLASELGNSIGSSLDFFILLSGKHVQGTTITDFLALQAPLERELKAVR